MWRLWVPVPEGSTREWQSGGQVFGPSSGCHRGVGPSGSRTVVGPMGPGRVTWVADCALGDEGVAWGSRGAVMVWCAAPEAAVTQRRGGIGGGRTGRVTPADVVTWLSRPQGNTDATGYPAARVTCGPRYPVCRVMRAGSDYPAGRVTTGHGNPAGSANRTASCHPHAPLRPAANTATAPRWQPHPPHARRPDPTAHRLWVGHLSAEWLSSTPRVPPPASGPGVGGRQHRGA
jgi:hypothetical protein